MNREGSGRVSLALALTCALALIAAAPLWHHEHYEPPEPSQCNHTNPDTGARFHDASGTVVFLADACPICLSQRLLGQSNLTLTAQLPSPLPSLDRIVDTGAGASVSRAIPSEARGPPLS
jgi:hypothetical protein